MQNLFIVGIIVIVALVALLILGMIISRLYRRASKEISFVRTGFGGQKVIVNGGALVFPVLHEIIPVNMNTLRLEVLRNNEEALITRDRMRVDVRAEFYVRVKPTEEAIADAAQTLGRRTMDPRALKELIEGKFVDALRAVAAEMAMEELHEKRADFVNKVQLAVTEDLLKNGLELESVSLTSLDQTDQSFFNPQNAFDASGLTRLTQEIQARRKQRNDIEQDTEVQIRQKNLEAERFKLEVSRDEEYARFEQQREVEMRRAQQASLTAQEQAVKDREAKQAQILAKQMTDTANIDAERTIAEQKLAMDQHVRERDIARERAVETAEIERKKTVELADQDRAIAIAGKTKEQSVAQAEADRARALAIKAAEQITTAKETEIAEREKAIQLVEARKIAEREAIGVTVGAEAEKAAAIDQAEAVRTIATGQANKVTITAKADADAEVLRADAAKVRYAVDAAGKKALHEAENVLDPAIIAMRIKIAVIENIDKIIRESVKPMEAIEGIKIIQVQGLNGGDNGYAAGAGGNGSNGNGNGGGNLADQVVNSALRYRSQAPLVDSLLKDIGLDGSSIHGLASMLDQAKSGNYSTDSNAADKNHDGPLTTTVKDKSPKDDDKNDSGNNKNTRNDNDKKSQGNNKR